MAAVNDVPVTTCATLYTFEDGGKQNSSLSRGLVLRRKDGSLLDKPDQIRSFGIDVNDNPFDRRDEFGMMQGDYTFDFKTEGTTVYFNTSCPTDEDLETYEHVVLTSSDQWDPREVDLGRGPKPDAQASAMPPHRDKRSMKPPYQHESDLMLGSISAGLVAERADERAFDVIMVAGTARSIQGMASRHRHSEITPERISKLFGIGLNKAHQLLRVTTQRGVRMAVNPITRRYRVDHLDLNLNRLKGVWEVDWLLSKVKSTTQSTGSFVYSNGVFTEVYPQETHAESSARDSLNAFIEDVGAPEGIKTDSAAEFTGRNSEFATLCRKRSIRQTFQEAGRSNQIPRVDVQIHELRKRWQHLMITKKVPRRMWCYGLKYIAKLSQFIPQRADGRTGYEVVTGRRPDISEYCDFAFWDLVWYHTRVHANTGQQSRALGRWSGVSVATCVTELCPCLAR
jgi:hypothetical protein